MARSQIVLPRSRRRADRYSRTVRAVWRDSRALWREFQRPILVFLAATLIGGWLYGELSVLAGNPRQPYFQMPFLMLTLMLVEVGTEIPTQPYLLIFWYVMPVLFVYIIGRGAVDFVRLFFNRGERRSAWEEAVASTYRDHIIIIGIGHVGLRIVRQLAQMGFDMVAVDLSISDELDDELSALGAPAIVADGRLPATLEKAGLSRAQSVVIATANDQVNLELAMRVRDINPHVRLVVRMWDDQYARQLKHFLGVEAVLSASDLSAPVFAGSAVGVEIAQTLRIGDEEFSMIRLQIAAGSLLDGGTVAELQRQHQLDIVLHERGGTVHVNPAGEMSVSAGDTLVLFARHAQVVNLVGDNSARR